MAATIADAVWGAVGTAALVGHAVWGRPCCLRSVMLSGVGHAVWGRSCCLGSVVLSGAGHAVWGRSCCLGPVMLSGVGHAVLVGHAFWGRSCCLVECLPKAGGFCSEAGDLTLHRVMASLLGVVSSWSVVAASRLSSCIHRCASVFTSSKVLVHFSLISRRMSFRSAGGRRRLAY